MNTTDKKLFRLIFSLSKQKHVKNFSIDWSNGELDYISYTIDKGNKIIRQHLLNVKVNALEKATLDLSPIPVLKASDLL